MAKVMSLSDVRKANTPQVVESADDNSPNPEDFLDRIDSILGKVDSIMKKGERFKGVLGGKQKEIKSREDGFNNVKSNPVLEEKIKYRENKGSSPNQQNQQKESPSHRKARAIKKGETQERDKEVKKNMSNLEISEEYISKTFNVLLDSIETKIPKKYAEMSLIKLKEEYENAGQMRKNFIRQAYINEIIGIIEGAVKK